MPIVKSVALNYAKLTREFDSKLQRGCCYSEVASIYERVPALG